MESEMSKEFSTTETIDSLIQEEIQALKQAEIVSAKLFRALEQQMGVTEEARVKIKKHHFLIKNIKKDITRIRNHISSFSTDVKGYWELLENQRIWLEGSREELCNDLTIFQELRSDLDNLC